MIKFCLTLFPRILLAEHWDRFSYLNRDRYWFLEKFTQLTDISTLGSTFGLANTVLNIVPASYFSRICSTQNTYCGYAWCSALISLTRVPSDHAPLLWSSASLQPNIFRFCFLYSMKLVFVLNLGRVPQTFWFFGDMFLFYPGIAGSVQNFAVVNFRLKFHTALS